MWKIFHTLLLPGSFNHPWALTDACVEWATAKLGLPVPQQGQGIHCSQSHCLWEGLNTSKEMFRPALLATSLPAHEQWHYCVTNNMERCGYLGKNSVIKTVPLSLCPNTRLSSANGEVMNSLLEYIISDITINTSLGLSLLSISPPPPVAGVGGW